MILIKRLLKLKYTAEAKHHTEREGYHERQARLNVRSCHRRHCWHMSMMYLHRYWLYRIMLKEKKHDLA